MATTPSICRESTSPSTLISWKPLTATCLPANSFSMYPLVPNCSRTRLVPVGVCLSVAIAHSNTGPPRGASRLRFCAPSQPVRESWSAHKRIRSNCLEHEPCLAGGPDLHSLDMPGMHIYKTSTATKPSRFSEDLQG